MLCVDTIFKMATVVGLLLLQIGLFGQNKWCNMGENAFHMVLQERLVFSHSSPNPALAATRLWAGYGELVGENSISWKTMWNAYHLELLVNTVGIYRSHVAQSAVFPWPLPTPHEQVS